MNPSVVVIGSCMIDLTSYAESLPRPGETVRSSAFTKGFGGKGANQCIAAARLGAKTAMVARVGKDTFGTDYLENFDNNLVGREHVRLTDGLSTGIACIVVDKKGENLIVITPGANSHLTTDDVKSASSLIRSSKIVVCQLEINESTTIEALKLAKQYGVMSLMNAAPGSKEMDKEIFSLADIFCVNETEASILTDLPVESLSDAEIACQALMEKGCNEVILTLGENGALYSSKNETRHILSPKSATVVDTTGAGDSFVGTMAYLLAHMPNLDRLRMVELACHVASTSVAAKGTQPSFLTKEELKEIIDF